MSQSRSFERAVGFYDQTRQLPPAAAARCAQAILEQAGPGARLLEVGVGTGRLAVPLLERGADVVGCDLSPAMMLRLRAKHPPARLARADAVWLPLAAGSFDAVLTAHVMHLIAGWQRALGEIRRVLRPGGVYINSREWLPEDSAHRRLREYWRTRVEAYGADWRGPGAPTLDAVEAAAQAMGAAHQLIDAAEFEVTLNPGQVVEEIAARFHSDSWGVPDEVFEAANRDLRGWARQEYGDLERQLVEPRRFGLDVYRFGAGPDGLGRQVE